MPQTVTGAIKQILAAQPSLAALVVTRDEAVQASETGVGFPYITVSEELSTVRDPASGRGVVFNREMDQVDIWQRQEDEDFGLKIRVERAFDAAGMFNLAPNGVLYRLLVESSVRMYDQPRRIVHHALTVRATRGI